jgi:CBS domain-containing protein
VRIAAGPYQLLKIGVRIGNRDAVKWLKTLTGLQIATSAPEIVICCPIRAIGIEKKEHLCVRRARPLMGCLRMTTIKQVLDEKGPEVFSIHPDASVYEAIKKMADENVGSLVVIENNEIVGIITERHYARNIVLKGRASPETSVRIIMETRVIYAKPEQTVEECMAVMTDKKIRHLPVVDEGRLIGIISIGDLVQAIISQQKFTIEQLEFYIYRQQHS